MGGRANLQPASSLASLIHVAKVEAGVKASNERCGMVYVYVREGGEILDLKKVNL